MGVVVVDSEAYREGYRIGYAAGKTAALRELADRVKIRPKTTRKRTSTPKCIHCGHAARTHGELSYCVGHVWDRMPDGTKYRGECTCTGFDAPKPGEES